MRKFYAGSLLLALLCFAFNARSQTDDLMIVEYMDAECGAGFQVKLYNPTQNPINLSGYFLGIANNGNNFFDPSPAPPFTPTCHTLPPVILQPGESYIIRNDDWAGGCPTGTPCPADTVVESSGVNGNDALVIFTGDCNNPVFVDMVGSPGFGCGSGGPPAWCANSESQTVGGVQDGLFRSKIVRNPDNCQRYTLTDGSNFNQTDGSSAAGWAVNDPALGEDMTGWTAISPAECASVGTGGAGQFAGFFDQVDLGPDLTTNGTSVTLAATTNAGSGSWNFLGNTCAGQPAPTITPNGLSADITNLSTDPAAPCAPCVYEFEFVTNPTGCNVAGRDTIQVTVASPTSTVGGLITPPTTVCQNASATLQLSGFQGDIVQWEVSTAGASGPFAPIANTAGTSTLYTDPITNNTTCFRALVNTASCSNAFSDTACVPVNGATIELRAEVLIDDTKFNDEDRSLYTPEHNKCQNSAGTVIRLFDAAAGWSLDTANVTILEWQSTTNCDDPTTFATLPGQQDLFYPAIPLPMQTTCYRAVYQTAGCNSSFSKVARLNVNTSPTPGSIIPSPLQICEGQTADLAVVGYAGEIVEWQYADDDQFTQNVVTLPITTDTIDINGFTTGTYFVRAAVGTAGCDTLFATISEVNVSPGSVAGTLSGAQTICNGDPAGQLDYDNTGQSGNVVDWFSSTDNFATATALGNAANPSLTPVPAPSQTTCYRVVVREGACPPDSSNEVCITVDNCNTPDVTPDGTFCSTDNNVQTLTLNNLPGGATVTRWELSADNFGTTTLIANTTTTHNYAPDSLTDGTCFRAVIDDGGTPVNSQPACITIEQPIAPGTISPAQTICAGETAQDLTLAGNSQAPTRWESSTDCPGFTAPTNITNTGTTESPGALSQTTCYRAVFTSANSCPGDTTPVVTITVNPVPTAGTITGAGTVCDTDAPGDLTLSGQGGNIDRWESSNDNFNTNFVDEGNAGSATFSFGGPVGEDRCYRAIVSNANCSDTTAAVCIDEVTCQSATITPNPDTVCTNDPTPRNLTVTVPAGLSVNDWEASTDGVTFNGQGNNGLTQVYSGLINPDPVNPSTFFYRVRLDDGLGGFAFSDTARIVVVPEPIIGTVSADQTICSGDAPAQLDLTGQGAGQTIGVDVVRWETSADCATFANPTTVPGTAGQTSFAPGAVTSADTCFRAVVSNGFCAEAATNAVTITTTQPTVPGTISAAQTLCESDTPQDLQLDATGQTGTVVEWRSSTDNFATDALVPGSAGQTAVAPLQNTGETCYRAVIQNGNCATANTNEVCVTITANSAVGPATGGGNVCQGDPMPALTVDTATVVGNIVRWEFSSDNFNTNIVPINSVNDTILPQPIATTCFRAVVQSGSCAETPSASTCITISNCGTGGDVEQSGVVCENDATVRALQLVNNVGAVVRWETSIDTFQNDVTPVADTDSTFEYSNLTQNTCFRAVVQEGANPEVVSSFACIEVVPAPSIADAGPDDTLCTTIDTLAANTPAVGNGQWTVAAGTADFDDPTDPDTEVTGLSVGSNLLVWSITNGTCEPSRDTVEIFLRDVPGPAIAGNDTLSCTGDMILQAVTPAIGTGQWTLVSGGGDIDVPSDPNSLIENMPQGATVLAWTVSNGVCPDASDTLEITVGEATLGGALTGGGSVCSGETGTLELNGNQGDLLLWESSTDNFATIDTVVSSDNPLTTPQIFGDVCFRALVQSAPCPAVYSTVECFQLTSQDAGSVQSPASICIGGSTGQLELTGNANPVIDWESSTDNFNTDVTRLNVGAVTEIEETDLQQTTWYRAVTQGTGNCAELFTQSVEITVFDSTVAGTLAGGLDTCATDVETTFTLENYSGDIVSWERSDDDGQTWTTLNGTREEYTTALLSDTTLYRAAIQNGPCPLQYSDTAVVNIGTPSEGGELFFPHEICYGFTSQELFLENITGEVLRWEASRDSGQTWLDQGKGGLTEFTSGRLTVDTWFRAIVQNDACPVDSSNVVEVRVNRSTPSGASNGRITAATPVCVNSNVPMIITGQSGRILRWEFSTDGGQNWSGINLQSSIYILTQVQQETNVRVVLQGDCGEEFSEEFVIGVKPGPRFLSINTASTCDGESRIEVVTDEPNAGYSINPTLASPNTDGIFNVPPGTYTIFAATQQGCNSDTTITVNALNPVPPTITTITGVSTSNAIVFWDIVPGRNVRYALRYRIKGSSIWTTVTDLQANYRLLQRLESGSEYEVQVAVACTTGAGIPDPYGSWSDSEFFTTKFSVASCDQTPIPYPNGIHLDNLDAQTVELHWLPVAKTAGYIVSFGNTRLNPRVWPQFMVCAPDTMLKLTGLVPGTNYGVRIKTNCSNCTTALDPRNQRSDWSKTLFFTTLNKRSGFEDLDAAVTGFDAKVYPNPNKGSFKVSANGLTGNAELVIMDPAGKTVLRRTLRAEGAADGEWQIDAGLSSGLYLLQIESGDQRKTVKIVVE